MAGTGSLAFREIEHKFVVPHDFDLKEFVAKLEKLKPIRKTNIQVQDTYYATRACPRHIFRHRIDAELQQLTVKSLESDTENRLEVNLELGLGHGNQSERVEAFLAPLGVTWRGEILKDVHAFYFDDSEIVFYKATFGSAHLACVEFEAVKGDSLEGALAILRSYEEKLGFDSKNRINASLFELLVVNQLPPTLKAEFQKHKGG